MSLIQELIDEGVMKVYHDYRSGGVNDLSGTGNDGLLVSGGQLNREGYHNDGAGSYVRLPFDSSVVFGNGTTDTPLTFISSMRILKDGANTMIHKPFFGTGTKEYTFRFPGGMRFLMRLYDDANSAFIGQWANSALNIGDNAICAGTYDASGTSAGIKLYVDGLLKPSSESAGGAYTAMNGTTANIGIGKFHVYYNISTIAFVLMIAKELTATEIATITSELRDMTWDKNVTYQDEDDKKAFVGGMGSVEGRNITGGFLGDTPFTVYTGSYHVGTETINGEECRVIEGVASGLCPMLSQIANSDLSDGLEGTWEFYVWSTGTSGWGMYFSENKEGYPLYVGYRIRYYQPTDSYYISKSNGVADTELMRAETGQPDQWNKITFTRSAAGEMALYRNDVLLTAVAGANPVTEATYSSSKYWTLLLEDGAKFAYASKNGVHAFKKENL